MRIKSRLMAAVLVVLFVATGVKAQEDVSDFLELGVVDAKIIAEAYLKPYGEMLGRTLNGGWYNSADVHKVAGFDFTVGVNMAMVPASGKRFDVAALLPKLSQSYGFKDPSVHIAPTAAGDMRTRPVLTYGGQDILTLPNGSGFDKFPMPIVQLGVGLPFHSEVALRFIPGFNIGDAGKIQMFGFALKHSVKEYLPFIKRVPFLSTTVMMGYTSLGSELNVDYEPRTNQELHIDSKGFTTRLLIGANLPVIAFYTGIGYGSTNSDFALKGDYEINGVGIYNPFTIGYTNTGFDANAGIRLRLGILAIHGDYSIGDYPMATVGVGLSFR